MRNLVLCKDVVSDADKMNVLPQFPGSYFVFPLPCQSVCQWHTPHWSVPKLQLLVALSIPHGKRVPLPSHKLLFDDLQNCAYCMLSARVDKSEILWLFSMIQVSSIYGTRSFFCCSCLQVITKNWLCHLTDPFLCWH